MTRISIKDLEAQVKRINKLTNSPETEYTKINGKLIGNIGNYHLDQAYGGVKLVRMRNESGGIEEITRTGFTTKRDLYFQLDAIITGLQIKGSL